MIRSLPVLLAATLVSSTLVAQVPGTFSTFGSGCSGKISTCISLNVTSTGIGGTLPNEYCYPALTTGATTVLGFEAILKAATGPFQTTGHLYFEDPLVPGQPDAVAAATGPMTLDVTEQFYSCTFAASVAIPANTLFWVAADTPAQHPSSFSTGNAPPGVIYWRRAGTTWSPTGIVKNPAYKITCLNPAGGGSAVGIPQIAAATMPEINKQFDVTLSGGAPNAPAFLFFGASNTALGVLPLPFDLGLIGASGCMVLTSSDVATPAVPIGAAGAATFSTVIPPSGSLVGNTLYLQWILIDIGANALGVITSNGGEAMIGG